MDRVRQHLDRLVVIVSTKPIEYGQGNFMGCHRLPALPEDVERVPTPGALGNADWVLSERNLGRNGLRVQLSLEHPNDRIDLSQVVLQLHKLDMLRPYLAFDASALIDQSGNDMSFGHTV